MLGLVLSEEINPPLLNISNISAVCVVKVGTDLELKEKLTGLKKLTGREKHEEMIDKIVNDLKRDS